MDLYPADVMAGVLPLSIAHPKLPGLHLRQLQDADAGPFHAAVTRPEIGRMLFMFPADWPLEDARALMAANAPRTAPPLRLAISAGDDRFLGSVGLVNAERAEIAYFLTPEAQGQGIMRATLEAFVAWIFTHFDMPALRARVYHDNPASMALLHQVGFEQTGREIGLCSAQRAVPERLHLFCLTKASWRKAHA